MFQDPKLHAQIKAIVHLLSMTSFNLLIDRNFTQWPFFQIPAIHSRMLKCLLTVSMARLFRYFIWECVPNNVTYWKAVGRQHQKIHPHSGTLSCPSEIWYIQVTSNFLKLWLCRLSSAFLTNDSKTTRIQYRKRRKSPTT